MNITKFYQAHILPKKFNVDKRRPHLSSLIRNGEISKHEALQEINEPLYDENELERDKEYFCKKLDFALDEFDQILSKEPKHHSYYKSDQVYLDILRSLADFINKIGLGSILKRLGIKK